MSEKAKSGVLADLPSPRILIVDDNPIHASNVKRVLMDSSWSIGKLRPVVDAVEDLTTARAYLRDDSIDIYILDLEVNEKIGEGAPSPLIGAQFVRDVVAATNAGVVVCSTYPASTEAAELLESGADDYVEKAYSADLIAARVYSVWRRTLQGRRDTSRSIKFAHAGRAFLVDCWRFVVGNRVLTDSEGNSVKLSPTEHAFLRYLVTVDDHSVDSEIFNIEVLDRDRHKTPIRLDNFVYRLRQKFGGRIEIAPQGNGAYKLLAVRELKPDLT